MTAPPTVEQALDLAVPRLRVALQLLAEEGDVQEAILATQELGALLSELRSAREALRWRPLREGDKLMAAEGESYLFAVESAAGWHYFSDSIVWDAETRPDWHDGIHGWQLDGDSFWFRPSPAPPESTT